MSEIITASLTVSGGDTIAVNLNTLARGPAGTGGSGAITSATTSDGTANLSISNVTTATATVSGIMTAPTAATTTSTTQVATTAFVQQELASGVAVAKNLEFLAHNGSGATIAKGSIVYVNGAVGGVPRITKAQANNDTNSARTIGFVKADIANGSNGFVIIEGELLNVSTADSDGIIGAGIQLYLSPTTPGAFTRTKPSAPQHSVYVGVVVTASTGVALDGKIIVSIQNGYELDDIHDVSITTPAAGQVIKRNAGNTLWVNEAIVSADVSDATDAATPSTLVRRDGNGGANFGDVQTSIITASGILTTGQVEFNGTDAGDSLTFNMVNYTYGAGAAAAHRTALNGGAATGDALFTAASASAARTTLGQITATSTAQIDSVAYTNGGTPVTGIQSIQLEADTLYELSWYGKFTSNGGSGYLWLNFSSAYDDLGNNGFQQFARFHNTVGSTFLVSTTAIAAAFANLGTLTTRTAHGSIRFKTVLATQVSLGWSQWNSGTVTGTSSLLTAFRVGIRPV